MKRTYDPPRYDPHQAVVSRKTFRLEPHPFSARFGYKYVDRERDLMMIFSQAQRDEMKTITRGTWPLALCTGRVFPRAPDSRFFSVRFHASLVLSLIEIREITWYGASFIRLTGSLPSFGR